MGNEWTRKRKDIIHTPHSTTREQSGVLGCLTRAKLLLTFCFFRLDSIYEYPALSQVPGFGEASRRDGRVKQRSRMSWFNYICHF